jgi:hypothetical protein
VTPSPSPRISHLDTISTTCGSGWLLENGLAEQIMALDRQHMQSTLDAAGIDFPEDKRRLRSSTRKSDLRSRTPRGMQRH